MLRRVVLSAGVLAVLIQWATLFLGRNGDFHLHWNWAHRFVEGGFLYAGGLNTPYPPFWAMAHVPLTLLPVRVAQVLVFALAVAALALILWILNRLTRDVWPLSRDSLFWANAAALFLTSRFLLQDLAHSGENSLLLALVWSGVFFWTIRREWMGGACLGLAVALKCTPALFLAYFAWKRQWRMAGATALAALLFSLAPILRQGPADYARHMTVWWETVWKGVSADDLLVGVLGPESDDNLSLKPALGRLVSRVPDGLAPSLAARGSGPQGPPRRSPGHAAGSWLVRLAQGLLLATVAWAFRGRAERGSARVLFELAGVGLLALLLSPITWRQHCVSILPAAYLLVRRPIARGAASVRGVLLLSAYVVLAIVLNRTVTGRDLASRLDSWSVLTCCLLGLLGAVVACARGFPRPAGRTGQLRMWTIDLPAPRLPAAE